MRIQTGRGTIPLITLIGIWSISALNALPGLAVTPILGKLSVIFPHSTELDVQMLSSLPSLLIIPFIILAGKLTEKVNFIRLLQVGLAIFALSGILYLFAGKMWQLIAISAMLGVGSGMIIPLSTGLISKYFVGPYRVKQFGFSSAITNITLVVATAVTGYLAEVNWHLPFVVYLFPLVSLVLSVYLRRSMISEEGSASIANDEKEETGVPPIDPEVGKSKYGVNIKHLLQVMMFYGLSTYLALIVTFNLPFLMEEYHFSSGDSGVMISLFFLAIMAPGLFLNRIVGLFREKTKFYSLLCIAVGLALIWISPKEWVIAPGCILVGLGYGVIQPVIYDKTTHTAVPKKVTLALAFVMMMNYLAILLCPFIIDFFQSTVFHIKSQQFAFVFNLCITLVALIWAYCKRNTFLFKE
ncbi:MFS transporter [Bacteroides salyersiae]|uniref:MFS transporter n=1 Tax=Bacteroides salyersiae TaxID=291644 RepID=UPI001898B073|nr:MFS transporter [Bacteroides salyersiae]MBT9874799.1 MFS transporter [Bacteroides salyersiae]MBV4202890.1 MFS transporter [Bacteroides salyersiae]MCB6648017.1 MFS transporter [Bacteroides salyersiae]